MTDSQIKFLLTLLDAAVGCNPRMITDRERQQFVIAPTCECEGCKVVLDNFKNKVFDNEIDAAEYYTDSVVGIYMLAEVECSE